MKYYILFSFIISFLIVVIECVENYTKKSYERNSSLWIRVSVWIFYILIGIFSITHAFIMLRNKGMIQEKINMVLVRHITFITIFTICNLYAFITRILTLLEIT